MKAIFLDRDGTIIKDRHYLYQPSDVEYFSDTFLALQGMQELGFELFLVTNQSGIGRGYFSEQQMHLVHQKIQEDMLAHGLKPFKDIAFCPHSPEKNCQCRKPRPKMIEDLCQKYTIHKEQSFMIGDKDCDLFCGLNAHLKNSFKIEKNLESELTNVLKKIKNN